jgi:hypothetical protein
MRPLIPAPLPRRVCSANTLGSGSRRVSCVSDDPPQKRSLADRQRTLEPSSRAFVVSSPREHVAEAVEHGRQLRVVRVQPTLGHHHRVLEHPLRFVQRALLREHPSETLGAGMP